MSIPVEKRDSPQLRFPPETTSHVTLRPGRAWVRWPMRILLLVFVVVTTGLVGSCGSSVENECQSVGAAYTQVLRDSALLTPGAAIEDESLAMASDVPGAWYIVAKVDGSISVWVTDRDPRGDKLGHIITGNRAAQRYSNPDFVDPPASRSETAQAAGDPAGIAVAEECIRG
jgi:hypothetical protein